MTTTSRLRRVALVVAGLLTPPAVLSQTVTGRAVIAVPWSSVRLSDFTERTDGLWGGVALEVRTGRFTVSGSGLQGRLTSSSFNSVPPRLVGEISIRGRFDASPRLGIDVGYATRAFSSAAGYQGWSIARVGAAVSRELGTPALRASAGLAYLPVFRVTDQERPSFGLGGDVGIAIAPPRSPITINVEYRIERFVFWRFDDRSEQFETLSFAVGVRARRIDGRWRIGGGQP